MQAATAPRGRGSAASARGAARPPAGVAHRQRQRVPAGEPAEVDDRWGDRRRPRGRRRASPARTRAVAAHVHDAVGVVHDTFEAVLGDQHGDAEVVHEAVRASASTSSAAVGSSADVGSSSTSTRGCAVSTEPIATRCCWPPESVRSGRARRSAMPSRSSVSSTRLRITSGGQAELLHRVGELLLDRVGDEPGERVLPDVADDVGQVARLVRRGCRARRRVTRPRGGRR